MSRVRFHILLVNLNVFIPFCVGTIWHIQHSKDFLRDTLQLNDHKQNQYSHLLQTNCSLTRHAATIVVKEKVGQQYCLNRKFKSGPFAKCNCSASKED